LSEVIMARKVYVDDKEDCGRWLLSYADFITLMFAFFVVLYSTSNRDSGKFHTFGDALTNAFSQSEQLPLPKAQNTIVPKEALQKIELERMRREKMSAIAGNIKSSMSSLMKEGQVRVTQTARGITVEINASLLFSSGQAELSAESIAVLEGVAQMLKEDDHDIQIEGHTDNSPINTPHYPTNWELSAARASRVARLFADNGVAPERLVAAGYGEFKPVESNATPEGKARNRRVIVTLLSSASEIAEDAKLNSAVSPAQLQVQTPAQTPVQTSSVPAVQTQ